MMLLTIEAQLLDGNTADALSLIHGFRRRYPDSPLLQRIDRAEDRAQSEEMPE